MRRDERRRRSLRAGADDAEHHAIHDNADHAEHYTRRDDAEFQSLHPAAEHQFAGSAVAGHIQCVSAAVAADANPPVPAGRDVLAAAAVTGPCDAGHDHTPALHPEREDGLSKLRR